ncbi:MAG: hypothetical protein OQK49_00700 [Proteobacteria bacterium]|nr:hypothetical protein [Pseudomonadota bacterium]
MRHLHLYLTCAIAILMVSLVTGCGNSAQKLTHFAAINERFETVFETTNVDQLKTINGLFHERHEANNAAAEFQYLLDLTSKDGTERWRCSANGYCQRRTAGTEMQVNIYRLERYRELYDMINLTVD